MPLPDYLVEFKTKCVLSVSSSVYKEEKALRKNFYPVFYHLVGHFKDGLKADKPILLHKSTKKLA